MFLSTDGARELCWINPGRLQGWLQAQLGSELATGVLS